MVIIDNLGQGGSPQRSTSRYGCPGGNSIPRGAGEKILTSNAIFAPEAEQSLIGSSKDDPVNRATTGFWVGGPGRPAYWGLIMLSAGDVERNPGPTKKSPKWPCAVCGLGVGYRISIQCRKCRLYVHAGSCSGHTATELRGLAYSVASVFRCSLCQAHAHAPQPTKYPKKPQPSNQNAIPALPPKRKNTREQRGETHEPIDSRALGNRLGSPRRHEATAIRHKDASTKRNRIRILQWNPASTKKKTALLSKILYDNDIDVAVLQETWCNDENRLRIKGYNAVNEIRRTSRNDGPVKSGGVSVLIKEGLSYSRSDTNPCRSDPNSDGVMVTLHLGKNTMDIVNVYAPPIGRDSKDLRTERFDPTEFPIKDNVIIMGDFNAHAPLWDNHQDTDDRGEKLSDFILSNSLLIANSGEPTRIGKSIGRCTSHSGLSAPDVTILHKNWEGRYNWTLAETDLSDHRQILLDLQLSGKLRNKPAKRYPIFSKTDWNAFNNIFNEEVTRNDLANEPSIYRLAKGIEECLAKATKRVVPMNRKMDPKPWWNRKLDELLSKCRQLRKLFTQSRNKTNHDEWELARKELAYGITKAKEESWKTYASKLNARSDPAKVMRTIHSIEGNKTKAKNNEALRSGTKVVSSDKSKASEFCKLYAGIRHMKHTKRPRKIKRANLQQLQQPCPCDSFLCLPFTAMELDDAIKDLASSMLASLNIQNKPIILKLFNLSWRSGQLPSSWTKGKIIPIIKKGKPATEMSSYRPIALTSCLCKLMEKMIKARLQFHLESKGLLEPRQAGFRALRSTEDQLMRITQSIADGFNYTFPHKRTVLALIDFSRAFDTVRKDLLIHKLLRLKLPSCTVKWMRSFLSNRLNIVEFNDERSGFRRFHNGVPQGSGLSPLLFGIFINDILEELPDGIEASLFADDVAIWAQDKETKEAAAKLQLGLDAIQEWAEKWQLTINVSKCECSLFSTWNKEGSEQAIRNNINLKLLGQPLPFSHNPTFLGVTFDRLLNFGAHAKNLKKKSYFRIKALSTLAGKKWGQSNENLRLVYLSYIRSALEYGAAAWGSSAASSHVETIDRIQNQAARIITGTHKGANLEALRLESNIPPISLRIKELTCISYEKSLRLPEDNPRNRAAVDTTVSTRPRCRRLTTQPSWRKFGMVTSEAIGLNDYRREQLHLSNPSPPWELQPNMTCNYELKSRTTKEDPQEVQRKNVEDTLRELTPANISIYTDGSCEQGTTNGGSGIVIINERTNEETKLKVPAGKLCSSFKAELVAIKEALSWIKRNRFNLIRRGDTEIRILSDSQSSIRAIKSGPKRSISTTVKETWQLLNELRDFHLVLQYVPGHIGIEGNEKADAVAKEATEMDQRETAIDIQNAKSTVRRAIRREFLNNISSEFNKAVYGAKGLPNGQKEEDLCRDDRTTLSQLRTNKSLLTSAYRHMIDPNGYPTAACPRCGHKYDDVTHLLIDCPVLDQARNRLPRRLTLGSLVDDPEGVLCFLSDSGVLV